MIQLGIEDDEISLQNTINQAKIDSFEDIPRRRKILYYEK